MRIRILFALCMAALFLSTTNAGERELRFSWWGGGERHEATLAAIELFEAKNPGIKIKAEYMGWNGYLERLTTQIGGGSEPDLMQMDWAWLALFSKNGDGFQDLGKFKDAVNLGAFDQKWINTCTVGGKLNALPVSFTTRFFIWNKTAWDKAGLPLPTTWEDIVDAGKVFQEKLGPEYFPLDMDQSSVAHMLGSYIYQKTGKMIIDPVKGELGLSREELKDCLDFYRRLIENHGITSFAHRAARAGDAQAQTHEQSDFITGKWGGAYYWDSNITLLLSTPNKDQHFELGQFPTMPGAKNSGRIGRPAQIFAVSKNSANPEATAALASFLLTSPEAAKVLRTTRGVLISNPSFESLKEADLISAPNLAAMDQLKGVEVYTPSPYFEDPRMLKIIDDVVELVSYGKATVDEAATELERNITRLLRRINR